MRNTRDRTAIADYTARVLDALSVEFGPTHTEIVLTVEGPCVIETHLRVGGDDIYLLTRDATGVDLIELQIRQVLGHKVLPEIREILAAGREPRCEAIWYAAPETKGGVLREIAGMPGPDGPQHVTVTALTQPGTELGGLNGSFARLAKARAFALTPHEALEAARSAAQDLSFVISVAARRTEMV